MSGRKVGARIRAINVPMSRLDDSDESALNPNEQEFIMTGPKSWEEALAEARAEGLADARAEVVAKYLFLILCIQRVEVPEVARERILAERDIDRLQRWIEKAVHASTIGEVLDDPR